MLKEELALDFSQWLHSGPKEMGEGGAFLIAPDRERNAKKHLPDLCKARHGWYLSPGHPA